MIPKFRFWDFDRSEMHSICRMSLVGGAHVFEYGAGLYDKTLYAPDRYVIMQWIGAKDMNGTDIYEGDIIRKEICSPDDMAYGCYGDIGVVKYDSDVIGFIIDNADTGDDGFYCSSGMNFSFDRIEVIGNVYENPGIFGTTSCV